MKEEKKKEEKRRKWRGVGKGLVGDEKAKKEDRNRGTREMRRKRRWKNGE